MCVYFLNNMYTFVQAYKLFIILGNFQYPNATPEQQKMITNRAIVDMYNYWEKQATLYNKQPVQPIRNTVSVIIYLVR